MAEPFNFDAAKAFLEKAVAERNVVPDLANVLRNTDPATFPMAFIVYVGAKAQASGMDALTPIERTVWHATDLEFREVQGTLFDEMMEEEARFQKQVGTLDAIGADRVAHALRTARALYLAVPQAELEQAEMFDDIYDLMGRETVDALERVLEQGPVADALHRFINANRARLRPD